MGLETDGLTRAEASALLAWWVEAGVDVAIQEEPRDWRRKAHVADASPGDTLGRSLEGVNGEAASEAGQTPLVAPQQLPQVPGGAAKDIQTLDAFHAWLAETADLPLFRAGAARALPHGQASAELMLIAGIPATEDAAEGRPIGGEAWVLTVRMLAAIGLTPEQAYVTAITCFSATGTRFAPGEADACRETVLAQIALVAPRRLLLLGDAPAKLLLDKSMAAARGKVHKVAGLPAVATFAPRHLLQNSQHKALAWSDLLLIMGEKS